MQLTNRPFRILQVKRAEGALHLTPPPAGTGATAVFQQVQPSDRNRAAIRNCCSLVSRKGCITIRGVARVYIYIYVHTFFYNGNDR